MKDLSMTGSNVSKPSIAVLMPMVWGIGNVIHSGVLKRLVTAGVDVHLFVREYDPATLTGLAYADFAPGRPLPLFFAASNYVPDWF